MAHIEILPPSVTSGIPDTPDYDDVGLWTISDLNSGNAFYAYTEDFYWNLENKDDFLRRVLKLWDKDTLEKTRGQTYKEERETLEDYISTAKLA